MAIALYDLIKAESLHGSFTSYPKFDSLRSLFIDQLQELYDAEQRLTKALPKMIDAASNAEPMKGLLRNRPRRACGWK